VRRIKMNNNKSIMCEFTDDFVKVGDKKNNIMCSKAFSSSMNP
jgi:hypothetical protein